MHISHFFYNFFKKHDWLKLFDSKLLRDKCRKCKIVFKMFLFKETKVMQGLKIPKYLFEH